MTKEDQFWDDICNLRQAHCPVCERIAQAYKRKLHPESVNFLRTLRRLGGEAHVRDIYPDGGKASTDASYAVHWGLVTKPGVGFYSLTRKGERFLDGVVNVPEWVAVYNHEVYDKSKTLVSVAHFEAVTDPRPQK